MEINRTTSPFIPRVLSMDTVREEALAALKHRVHQHVRSNDVFARVRQVLAELAEEAGGLRHLSEEDVIDSLQERGVLDHIVAAASMEDPDVAPPPPDPLASALIQNVRVPNSTQQYLRVRVMPGRAFLSRALRSDVLCLHVSLGSQRFRSRDVPSCGEPCFQDTFLFDLGVRRQGNPDVLLRTLLHRGHGRPLCMAVVERDPTYDRATLIGTHQLEWRKVVCTGSVAVTAELVPPGGDGKTTTGIVELRVDFVPGVEARLDEESVMACVEEERLEEAQGASAFVAYAREWWKEYTHGPSHHKRRLVKIFARGEDGVSRSVCSFVQPLRTRLFDSPFHAARFVSLLPYEREEAIGGGRTEVWHTMHTFLAKERCDVEDHALLLCSLLLGFGLDAYVCVGTDTQGAHVWVMTRGGHGHITFWESLTAQRLAVTPTSLTHSRYKTVSCLFRHDRFYANIQESESCAILEWDLDSRAHWKGMDPEKLALNTALSTVSLLPSVISPREVETRMEESLCQMIEDHRREDDMDTHWDLDLAHFFLQALFSYEWERVAGTSMGVEEFQDAIRRHVPQGHTFKGFPLAFTHRSPSRALTALLKAPVASQILETRREARFAIRVRVFPYAENVYVCWCMLGVIHRLDGV